MTQRIQPAPRSHELVSASCSEGGLGMAQAKSAWSAVCIHDLKCLPCVPVKHSLHLGARYARGGDVQDVRATTREP